MRRRHVAAISVVALLILYWCFPDQHGGGIEYVEYAKFDSLFIHGFPPNDKRAGVGATTCSMATCFNWTKCADVDRLKFYVYPTDERDEPSLSGIYSDILQVLRLSPLYTNEPTLACLFILSIDTLDRDKISEAYVKNVNSRIAALPQDVWNNGTNHLIFNLYFGTYPHYLSHSHDMGFYTGNAMVAWASSHQQNFRHAFDIAFPLFHKDHPLRSPINPTKRLEAANKYFASFKGKRYVYGIGSETRDLLHHFHNNGSIIVATTCRHNTDWKKYEDSRCSIDNRAFDRWDYNDLMENSTFCFVPRGRRLGSYRFLEALRAACLPVVLSDGWMLPFSERIDWSQAAINGQESTVLFALDHLYAVSEKRILKMKRRAQLLYHRYFSSVEKIVLTSVDVVFERVRQATAGSASTRNWDSASALVHYIPPSTSLPTFTVVVQAINSASSRLNRIIGEISRVDGVRGVLVLWPSARGPPPDLNALFPTVPIRTKGVEMVDQGGILDGVEEITDGEFIVSVDERVRPSAKELIGAMRIASRNPSRLITFYSAHYQKCPKISWALFRHFLREYRRRIATKSLMAHHHEWFMPQCDFLLLNFLITDLTLEAPMWLERHHDVRRTDLASEPWVLNHNHSFCFNRMVTTMYDGTPPLLTSDLRYPLP